jgi:hypothetical protein
MTAQGKWMVTIDTPMGEKAGVLDLQVDGVILSGHLSAAQHSAPILDGRVDGNRLTWSATVTQPLRMTVKFSATIDADRIEGKAKYLLGSASFHGRRV